MAGIFNEDESTEDEIDVDLHLGERLRINRGENSNFMEVFENSKDFKQYCNMNRKKFAQEGQSSSSSSVEVQNDIPTAVLNNSDNYHNKKRQNGDKNTEQLANPKRTCLSDRFCRSPEWLDYRKKTNNHDSQLEKSLFPDAFYLHRDTSPDLFDDKKSEEHVNSLADAEDSDFEVNVTINRNNKIDSGQSSKNSKIKFPISNKAQNVESKTSTRYKLFDSSEDESKNSKIKFPTSNKAQNVESKASTSYKLFDSSEDESKSVIQNGALKGGRQESSADHSYYNKKVFGHKVNRRVLDSDESEDDSPLAKYRSKPVIFSSSDSEDFRQNSTKNKHKTSNGATGHSNSYEDDDDTYIHAHAKEFKHMMPHQKYMKKNFRPMASSRADSSDGCDPQFPSGDFDENGGSHSKQFKHIMPHRKFTKKSFCPTSSNRADSSDGCDRQFHPPDFQRKTTSHRPCKSHRNNRITIPSNFAANGFTKSSNMSVPVRGRRITGGERGARRSGSPHHRSNRGQHKADECKSRGRSVSVSRTQTEKPSYAARYPDVFDAEESDNEFFTANSYSDTETSAESLVDFTAIRKPPNQSSSVSCTTNSEVRFLEEDTSDDEISVVFSTGPYGRNNDPRRGTPRTLGRRHSRGTPHRQVQNSREVVSISPDPVEQVRQMEEDERMARMLQAQFDAEADPDYIPFPSLARLENDDSDDDIIDPHGDSDSDERSFSSPERSVSPLFPLFSINHRGLGMNRFNCTNRSASPMSIYINSRRMDTRIRRRTHHPVPSRERPETHYRRMFGGLPLPEMAASILDDYEALLTLDLDDEAVPRGLPKSDINRLPTRKYIHPNSAMSSSGSEMTHRRTELNKECQVCLTDYETGDVLRILPCFHEFHTPCIDPWLTINHTCPVCRVTVDLDA